jgi:molybdate transport system substrate-binding protein
MRRPVVLAAAALLLAGCGGSAAQSGGAASETADGLSGTLTVFAAASLTDVFEKLGGDFRDAHPQVDVRFNYGPSSGLAQSIVQGAPADVFASANQAQMSVVANAGLAAGPVVVASNVLEIAVPPGNPDHVRGLADFARPELTLAVCAPQVPCGAAAEQVFRAAGIKAAPDSQEEDVRAALTKVQLGEVDAALVYATDVLAAGDQVATRFSLQGMHRGELMGIAATGRSVTLPGITILRFANGKCVERWSQADFFAVMVQIGAVPAPA